MTDTGEYSQQVRALADRIVAYMEQRTWPFDEWHEAAREAIRIALEDARDDTLWVLSIPSAYLVDPEGFEFND